MTSYTLTLCQQAINPSQLSIPQFLKNFFFLSDVVFEEKERFI